MIGFIANYVGGKITAYLVLAGIVITSLAGFFAYQKYDDWRDERRGLRAGNEYYRKVVRDPQQRVYDAEKNIISRENNADSQAMKDAHQRIERKMGN